ncbi:MAG TPA: hypothetical protein VFX01_03635 [Methylophilaceae bacterium]|nr:hypothetical protein [Methylophilaceae bacterium]
MIKTTKELKDAVEARIDVEQRKLILQILSKNETLDEQTTEKLQQLMREVERREEKNANLSQMEQVDLTPQTLKSDSAPWKMAPDQFVGKTPFTSEALQPNIEQPEPANESPREKELAELERKNAEMSQMLEQLTREKQNTLMNHLAQDPAGLDTEDLAFRAHHITERLNKDEPGWIRAYLPIIVLIIFVGLAAWAFFTLMPVQPWL